MGDLILNFCVRACENSGINHFWSVKNSLEVLVDCIPMWNLSSLFKVFIFQLHVLHFYIISCDKNLHVLSSGHEKHKNYVDWDSFGVLAALKFLLDNIFVRFGEIVCHQDIGNSAPLVADLFLYCYRSQFVVRKEKDPSKQHLVEETMTP